MSNTAHKPTTGTRTKKKLKAAKVVAASNLKSGRKGSAIKMSKSAFKAKALEVMRDVEATGNEVIITDHGNSRLTLGIFKDKKRDPLDELNGSVIDFTHPTQPVAEDEWGLA